MLIPIVNTIPKSNSYHFPPPGSFKKKAVGPLSCAKASLQEIGKVGSEPLKCPRKLRWENGSF